MRGRYGHGGNAVRHSEPPAASSCSIRRTVNSFCNRPATLRRPHLGLRLSQRDNVSFVTWTTNDPYSYSCASRSSSS
jgi:hypothetical protein